MGNGKTVVSFEQFYLNVSVKYLKRNTLEVIDYSHLYLLQEVQLDPGIRE
jgi:hypothetical protein